LANETLREPTGPSTATVNRLFAQSGNRCAFPRCPSPIIVGKTIVGEICHITAQSVGGSRYDPEQTAAARHAYDNLILLCSNHHVVVDDDPEAYTVERLIKMKNDHEQRTPLLSGEQVESVSQEIRLLIDQSVTAFNQSGGITAHTVNIHVNTAALEPKSAPATSPQFPAAEPKQGQARFRSPDQRLGVHWSSLPFLERGDYDIHLSDGPAMWLRLMPKVVAESPLSFADLQSCAAMRGSITLQPFQWSNLSYLREEDGFGTYSIFGPRDSETTSVAFAFETGEVWSVDTSLLAISGQKNLYFETIARAFMPRLRDYGRFLENLGFKRPFDWIAGLDRIKGWRLQVPPPPNHMSISPGNPCLSDTIMVRGSYIPDQAPQVAIKPFFDQLFRKCGTQFPDHLSALFAASAQGDR
jgi:hypothetical protein